MLSLRLSVCPPVHSTPPPPPTRDDIYWVTLSCFLYIESAESVNVPSNPWACLLGSVRRTENR